MNLTALRQRPQWIVIGVVIFAAVVGGALRVALQANSNAQSTKTTLAPPTNAADTGTANELFESPMISLSAELRKAATPSELVRSTPSDDRLSVVASGRPDPFAPITQSIGATTTSRPQPLQQPATSVPISSDREAISPALPTTSIARAPDLPPIPALNSPAAVPSIPVAANPLPIPSLPSTLPAAEAFPQTPIQAVELTGVVQVGDRVGVIVREGQGQSSRHLFEGDLLAGGQIRLKAIDLSEQEPKVILEYEGKEYVRMVG
ncbi:MAG: hypothetical protein ACFBSG_08575 [Leptolyngbyaceae cyanobacterium]